MWSVAFVALAGCSGAGSSMDAGRLDAGHEDAACGEAACVSDDARLIALDPSTGVLTPAFDTDLHTYRLEVAPEITGVTITPTVDLPDVTIIRVNAARVMSGSPSDAIPLIAWRPSVADIVVEAESGRRETYRVQVVHRSTYIKASNTEADDAFGWAMALSSDGTTLAVGAAAEASGAVGADGDQTDNSAADAGAVYVFTHTAEGWMQEAYLKPSNMEAGDGFGMSLALSGDGNTLAVGAVGEDSASTGVSGDPNDDSASAAGAVYVFTRASAWSQTAYLKASNTEAGDMFGSAVALSTDSTRLAIGASMEASAARGVGGNQSDNSAAGAGAVYVFSYDGSTWSQEAYLKASNSDADDYFASDVAISGDGTRLVVASMGEASSATGVGGEQTDNSALRAGAAYIFARTSETWAQEAYVKASNTEAGDLFTSVAISGDGGTVAVGAEGEDSGSPGVNGDQEDNSGSESGAVYVFGYTGGVWSQVAYLKQDVVNDSGELGFGLALSTDGSTLVAGATGEASPATGINGPDVLAAADGSGAVYVFTRAAGSWAQAAYVKASNTDFVDQFGWSVACSGDGLTLAAAARNESSSGMGIGGDQSDNSANHAGAVYIY